MHMMRPADDGSGIWTLGLATVPPTAKIPLFNPHDTGKFVKAMVMRWEQEGSMVAGKRVLGATDYWTPLEIVEGFRDVFPKAGKDAKFVTIPVETYRKTMKSQGMPDFVVTEMEENLRLLGEFGYFGGRAWSGVRAWLSRTEIS